MKEVAISLSLVAVALFVSWRRRLDLEKDLLIATARALVQLLAIAAVIKLVFENFGLAAVLLPVMLGTASWTSGRRLKGVPNAAALAALAIAPATALALVVLFGAGAFEFEPRFLIPLAGMLIGNAMTATSLAGARVRDDMRDKRLEVETRLSLGVPARDAVRPLAQRAASNALIPTIDSTKNVGVIFLPGAFVGMVIAGATPLDAAKVQLVVLFMLLGAVAVAGMLTTALVTRAFLAPGERIVIPAE